MRVEPVNLLKAYRALLRQFGPQGWWPVYRTTSRQPRRYDRDPDMRSSGPIEGRPGGALQRFTCPKRLTESDRFQICIGAILTQNTAWRNVEIALGQLLNVSPPPRNGGSGSDSSREARRAKWERGRGGPLTSEHIVSLPCRRLASLIRPAGYFNQKAQKLQIFSRWLLKRYDGSLARFFRQPTDVCRMELLSLWGIGQETADSMLLYAGRHSVFVVDAYTKRWLAKVAEAKLRPLWTYDEYQRFFMDRLPHDAQLFNEFHALIVAWGKRFGSRKIVVGKLESSNRT